MAQEIKAPVNRNDLFSSIWITHIVEADNQLLKVNLRATLVPWHAMCVTPTKRNIILELQSHSWSLAPVTAEARVSSRPV